MSNKPSKEPDAFIGLAEKTAKAIEGNQKPLLSAVVILFLAGATYGLVETYQKMQEEKSIEKLYQAEAPLNKKIEGLEKSAFEALKDKKGDDVDTAAIRDEAVQLSDIEQELASLAAFARSDAGSKAAARGGIRAAALYSKYGQSDQALSLLQDISKSYDKGSFYYGPIKMSLGTLFVEKGDLDSAIAQFQDILNAPASAYLHADTKLRMGMAYQKSGDLTNAKRFYTEVKEQDADGEVGRLATQYLRLLTLKERG